MRKDTEGIRTAAEAVMRFPLPTSGSIGAAYYRLDLKIPLTLTITRIPYKYLTWFGRYGDRKAKPSATEFPFA